MTEAEAKTQLETEGYRNVSAWLDSPDFSYSEHRHHLTTGHIIISGIMTLTMDGATRTLYSGERIDVPAQTVHTVVMGPDGCTYVSGEK